MILHENCLPTDNSYEISCLICYFWKSGKICNCRLLQIIGGALRLKTVLTTIVLFSEKTDVLEPQTLKFTYFPRLWPWKLSLGHLNTINFSWIILKSYNIDAFVWFDSLRPINNLSAIKGRVFLGWTSTFLGLMFLLKDTTQWCQWGSNPRHLSLKSSTLPLRSILYWCKSISI